MGLVDAILNIHEEFNMQLILCERNEKRSVSGRAIDSAMFLGI